jgi:hypothetical protein
LPADGTFPVSSVGPTFWFGGTVKDTNPKKIGGEGFLELQFYPDSFTTRCASNGGFAVEHQPDVYTACSLVWTIAQQGNQIIESAAFNGMLMDAARSGPFVMHALDIVDVHIWAPSPTAAYQEQVTDENSGRDRPTATGSSSSGKMRGRTPAGVPLFSAEDCEVEVAVHAGAGARRVVRLDEGTSGVEEPLCHVGVRARRSAEPCSSSGRHVRAVPHVATSEHSILARGEADGSRDVLAVTSEAAVRVDDGPDRSLLRMGLPAFPGRVRSTKAEPKRDACDRDCTGGDEGLPAHFCSSLP